MHSRRFILGLITAEPAWHRRQRKQRQLARGLLAVSAARHLLRRHHGSGMAPARNGKPAASDRHKRQWKCKRCGEWTWLDKDRCHDCNGHRAECESVGGACGGERPQAGPPGRRTGTKRGGGACGGERPQADTEGFVPTGQNRKERRAAKQLEKDLAELKERREKEKVTEAAAGAEAVDSKVAESSSEVSAINKKIKLAERAVKYLKDTEAEVREYVYGSTGAFDQALAKAVADLERAHAEKRGTRSLHEQKCSAEAHLKRLQGKMGEATVEASALHAQKEDIDKKISEQAELTARLQSDVEKAKTDVLALSDKIAEELRGSGAGMAGHVPGTSSEATASAVKGYLQGLPEVVSADPEGQQAIQQVLSLLGRLDEAAKIVASEAAASSVSLAPSAEGLSETMEIDDDLFSQMAEAAVAPAGEGDTAAEERKTRVAEAKARLRSNKKDLEQGMAKVRKVVKKGGA